MTKQYLLTEPELISLLAEKEKLRVLLENIAIADNQIFIEKGQTCLSHYTSIQRPAKSTNRDCKMELVDILQALNNIALNPSY